MVRVPSQEFKNELGKTFEWCMVLANDSPMLSCTQILADHFQSQIIILLWDIGETGQEMDGISNVQSTYVMGINQLIKDVAIGNSLLSNSLYLLFMITAVSFCCG